MAEHLLAREPAPLGEALGEVAAPRRHRARPRRQRERRPAGRRRLRARARRRARAARRPAARRHRPAPAGPGSASRPSASSRTRAASRSTCTLRAGGAALGDRRRHRDLAADPRRQVPGRGRRGEHPRRAARGRLRGRPAGGLHRPAGGRGRRHIAARSAATAMSRRSPKTATYTRAYADSNGFLTLLSDGERLTGAYALGPGGRRVAAAGDAGDPRPRPARCPERHDPAVPDVLGDLRRGAQGAPSPRSRRRRARSDQAHRWRAEARQVAGIARSDGRADRRQCRHRPRDRPAGPQRGRRSGPRRAAIPRRLERAGAEVGARSTAAFDANDAQALRAILRRPPRPDRPRPGHGPPALTTRPCWRWTSEDVRRALGGHVVLGLEVARSASPKMRPGGTLLFMGGTGGRRISRRARPRLRARTAALPPFVASSRWSSPRSGST